MQCVWRTEQSLSMHNAFIECFSYESDRQVWKKKTTCTFLTQGIHSLLYKDVGQLTCPHKVYCYGRKKNTVVRKHLHWHYNTILLRRQKIS